MQAIIGRANSGKTKAIADILSRSTRKTLVLTNETTASDYMLRLIDNTPESEDYRDNRVHVRSYIHIQDKDSVLEVAKLILSTTKGYEDVFIDMNLSYRSRDLYFLRNIEDYLNISLYVTIQARDSDTYKKVSVLDIGSLLAH